MEKKRIGLKCKELMIKEIEDRLGQDPNLFIASFSKMSVSDQYQLREKLRQVQANLLVTKNQLLKRIFEDFNIPELTKFMKGLTALAFGGNDSISISKVLI